MTKVNLVDISRVYKHRVFNPEIRHRKKYVHQIAKFDATITVAI